MDNSFWLWVERGAFSGPDTSGQRPSVILRGNHTKCNATTPDCWPQFRGVDSTYLVRFDRCVFSGGAVQYQQITMGEQVRPRLKLLARPPANVI